MSMTALADRAQRRMGERPQVCGSDAGARDYLHHLRRTVVLTDALAPLPAAVDGGVTGRGGADWLVLTTPVVLGCLYSRVMCWVALDRAIALADLLRAADRVDGWKHKREEIWESVVRDGWSEQAGAFTQYVGSTAVDASKLMMPIVGFIRSCRGGIPE